MKVSQNIGNSSNNVCQNCGEMVAETCKFCPKCGAEIAKKQQTRPHGQICAACGTLIEENGRFCPKCGTEVAGFVSESPRPIKKSKPMKWYKFVIWVQLFLGAIVNLVTGIRYLTGTIYGDAASQVYLFCEGLKGLDILLGLFFIAGAVLAIFVRQSLAHYKKSGPGMYYIYCIYGIIVNAVYFIGIALLGLFDILGGTVGTRFVALIVGYGIVLALNVMYFTKRKDLFIN